MRTRNKTIYYRLLSFVSLLSAMFLVACGDNSSNQIRLISSVPAQTKAITTSNPVLDTATPDVTLTAAAIAPTDTPNPANSNEVLVSLDYSKPGPTISPYIYGLDNFTGLDSQYLAGLHPTLLRWGGDPASRFNWVIGNAWNTSRDFGFKNGNYGLLNQNVANETVQSALNAKMAMLITIPTIGWVAKNSDSATHSLNVPDQGGPPIAPNSEAIANYNPAANRALTSVQSFARKNGPFVVAPNPDSTSIYQDEWVASLVSKFGTAAKGGVKFYAMDNEPDVWSQTHTDVHPTRVGYDELWSRFQDYASAVKDVDPTALVTGPVSAGWIGYFFSELDRGDDNFKTGADRANHGNQPLLPWFLSQARQYEQQKGKRILDVLDIHFNPVADGIYAGNTDPDTNAKRLRSTRSLWDLSYIDESWIGTQIKLIPRMQDWINSYYPGTKLAISEWNFGADNTLNGALAISQVLGIFGSQNVYMASYQSYPAQDSPGYEAFRLYTNFDGKGSSFGDKSVPVKISNDAKVSSYAALDSATGHLRLILINQQPDKDQPLQVQTLQNLPAQNVAVYQLDAQTANHLTQQPSLKLGQGSKIELTLPAYSITLLDILPSGGN